MVETLITVITTLLMTHSSLTTHLLAIFKVIKVGLSIFKPKYLIIGIVITLIFAPPSTNISHNINTLHLHINDQIIFTLNYYGIQR